MPSDTSLPKPHGHLATGERAPEAQQICPSCGMVHSVLSGSIPVSLPTQAAMVPQAEREERIWTNGELCVVDDERFYLYGSVVLSIHGHAEEFSWGAWAEVSEAHFMACQDLMAVQGREATAPLAAVLGTDIPFYPVTLGLPLQVHLQPLGLRPLFRLDAGEHPLVLDQAGGVPPERIHAIRAWLASLKAGSAG